MAKLKIAPADHLVLLPIYVRELDRAREALRAKIKATISSLQDRGQES